MSTATVTGPPAPAPGAAPSRIGPFEILGRMAGDRGAGTVSLAVRGLDGTPFCGRTGVAQCFSAPGDRAGRARLDGLLAGLVGLAHPAISAPIHADVAGDVAYVINPWPALGIPWDRPRLAPLPPSLVAEHLIPVCAALETAHRSGFSHGDLSRGTVTIEEAGPLIGGWTLFGRGPAADQLGLADLVIDWLGGSPPGDTAAGDTVDTGQRRVEGLRRRLDGITERVVGVLARASEPGPANRYPSITDFVAAFQAAVTHSAEDLVHGGFQAISSRTPETAVLMAAVAARYDPQSPGLDLLDFQLGSIGELRAPTLAPNGPTRKGAIGQGVAFDIPSVMAGLDPALTAGIPPEMLRLIAPPLPTMAKSPNHPWLTLMIGAAGLTLLLIVGLAIAMLAGSR